jgi:hypothetical protein
MDSKESEQDNTAMLELLASEFLNIQLGHETAIDNEAYLLENMVPTVVLALQSLLIEVKKKGYLENKGITTGAKHFDTPQIPHVPFDPINWMAQWIFRHNPKHLDAKKQKDLAYAQKLKEISAGLNVRVGDIVKLRTERQEQQRQIRLAEKERKRLLKEKLEKERKEAIETKVGTIFNEWSSGLMRMKTSYVTTEEIVSLNTCFNESLRRFKSSTKTSNFAILIRASTNCMMKFRPCSILPKNHHLH